MGGGASDLETRAECQPGGVPRTSLAYTNEKSLPLYAMTAFPCLPVFFLNRQQEGFVVKGAILTLPVDEKRRGTH